MSAPTPSLTELLNGAGGFILVASGVIAGAARSVAVLRGMSADRVERATAGGFLTGAALALSVIVWTGS